MLQDGDLSKRATPTLGLREGGAVLCAIVASLGLSLPASAKHTILTFDPPGSTNTTPESINKYDAIAGSYDDNVGTHGFVRTSDGTIVTFDVSGATSTFAKSINSLGTIAGYYIADTYRGFLRAPDGTITTYDTGQTYMIAPSISNKGAIAGESSADGGTWHGFVRSRMGKITLFDVPGASSTTAGYINSAGTITGECSDNATGLFHAFVRERDGTFLTFDGDPSASATFPVGINRLGTIVGYYQHGAVHSFERTSDGTIATIDPPTATSAGATGISNNGRIVGWYEDSEGLTHGFVRRNDGSTQTLDVPASPATVPKGIGGRGSITGFFVDSSGVQRGFIRTAD